MSGKSLTTVIFGLLFIAFLQNASAQVRLSSSLRGTVTDVNGAAIPGASFVLTNEDTGTTRTTVSAGDGEYYFEQLPPGNYRLQVERSGFKTVVRKGLRLSVSTSSPLDVQMEIGELGETVTTEAGASPLNTGDVTIGNVIGEREVKNLPSASRNPINLVSLQPGVVFTGETDNDRLLLGLNDRVDDREGATFGVRGNQTNVQLDGADVSDPETQAAFGTLIPVTLDSLKEFRVITHGANASEPSTGGPQVFLITNNGTNDLTGNLRFYHRNEATASNDFFNKRAGFDRPKLRRSNFGGSLGGPIRRDRMFFFGDYDGRVDRSEIPQNLFPTNVFVPSDTLREGIIRYRNTAGQIVSLSGDGIRFIDPAGLGVNPAALAALQLYPRGNTPVRAGTDDLNIMRFSYSAPLPTTASVFTGRFDYNITPDGAHTLYIRSNVADIDSAIIPALFPGASPSQSLVNKSKGLVASYTAQISPRVFNNLTFGYSRPDIERTGQEGNTLRFFPFTGFGYGGDRFGVSGETSAQAIRGTARKVSIYDGSDDVTWTRGNHIIQFGGLARSSTNRRTSGVNALTEFQTFPFRCIGDTSCLAGVNRLLSDPDPTNNPNSLNAGRIRDSFFALAGLVSTANTTFNFNPKTGRYEEGNPRVLEFVEDTFEVYAQDSWRVRPNLTITAGLRYSYNAPLRETTGQQLVSTVSLGEWFDRRVSDMNAGIPADRAPLVGFDLPKPTTVGRFTLYEPDYNNLAPRAAVAWSPDFKSGFLRRIFGSGQQSVIRAGFGVYYERVGGPLSLTTDQFGANGLYDFRFSSNVYTLAQIPRFNGTCTLNGCTGLPPVSNYLAPPTPLQLPFVPGPADLAPTFAVDDRLRNPSTTHVNFSFQRELPGKWMIDVGYVGTFGRNQLLKADLAQYYGELRDPQSGQTLWGAFNQILDIVGPDLRNPRVNPNNAAALASVQPIAFFQNMLPNLPSLMGNPALSPTQAFYKYATGYVLSVGPAWSLLLSDLDTEPQFGSPSPWNTQIDPERDGFVLFNPQFTALRTWTNFGRSDYHGGQLTVRRRFGSAQFALNYTFSKSLDNASAAENDRNNFGGFTDGNGQVANPFRPNAHRALSDFDVRHNLNAHWVIDLPFGRGKSFLDGANPIVNALIGGWELAGVVRYHSGFPLSILNGNDYYATSYLGEDFATAIGDVRSSPTRRDVNGQPNLFNDPVAARALFTFTRPGEVGSRNVLRGPGFFTADLSVHKSFKMPWQERHQLHFMVAAYNAFNNVNLSIRPPYRLSTMRLDFGDPRRGTNAAFDPRIFGRIERTVGSRGGARELEFAVRYSF